VLKLAYEKKTQNGKSIGIESTTLEANAAMKSTARKDGGATWKARVARIVDLGSLRELLQRRHRPAVHDRRGCRGQGPPQGFDVGLTQGTRYPQLHPGARREAQAALTRPAGRIARGRLRESPARHARQRPGASETTIGSRQAWLRALVRDRRGARTWIRGKIEVGNRHLVHAMAHNLGVILRKMIGVG